MPQLTLRKEENPCADTADGKNDFFLHTLPSIQRLMCSAGNTAVIHG